jgi:hypothetical protein
MQRYEDPNEDYSDPFEGGWRERFRANRSKRNLFTFLVGAALIASTLASNITIGNGRIEMGQGLYLISTCDQWVGIGLYPTAATYSGQSRVQTVEVIGLDPRKCANVNFKIKMFKNTDLNTPLPLFTGTSSVDSTTGTVAIGNVTQLAMYDTATISYPSVSYNSYAAKALTLVNQIDANVGYGDSYHSLSYVVSTGRYRVTFTTPLCAMADVDKITIESSSPNLTP